MHTDYQDRAAWNFREWCARNGFGPTKGYELLKTGEGPRTYTVGNRRYVSIEADLEWRASREKACSDQQIEEPVHLQSHRNRGREA